MEYNYNECTTRALEEEQARIAEQYENLTKEINRRKREEADRKRAQLALEKKKRQEEINEAKKKYDDLVHAFIKDYGSYEDSFFSWFARL